MEKDQAKPKINYAFIHFQCYLVVSVWMTIMAAAAANDHDDDDACSYRIPYHKASLPSIVAMFFFCS